MTDVILEQFDVQLDDAFDRKLDELLALDEANFAAGGASGQTGGGVKEYQTVGPEARNRLKGILKHYAKMPHPFTACVRDNRKRFGERTEAVCAVLKDIIRGTTKWRGHNNPTDHGSAGIAGLSEFVDLPTDLHLDEETIDLIDRLDELDLWELLGLAELDDAPSQAERELFYKKHGRDSGVSLKRDRNGFYVHMHRARSKSYRSPDSIPAGDVAFIESTG